MVRCPRRQRAAVHPRILHRQIVRQEDPVQRGQRARCRKAVPCRHQVMVGRKVRDAAGRRPPLVHVTHQQGRHPVPGRNRLQDRPRLPPPHKARQVQVHPHHADCRALHVELRQHRAPRLQRRDLDPRMARHHRARPGQNRVSVPADRRRPNAQRHRMQVMGLQKVTGQRRRPFAQAPVGFLQHHDVGADLGQHVQNALRAAAVIPAHRLPDIIAAGKQGDGHADPPQLSAGRARQSPRRSGRQVPWPWPTAAPRLPSP